MVALLAGNLVRDQTGDVIADLSLPAPKPRRVRQVPISVGIFPPVSTDLAYGEPVIPWVSINALVGVSPGLRGVALAGAIDIQRDLAAGAQLAGVTSVALRDLDGFQGAGAASIVMRHLDGMQLAGGMNLAGSFDGMQLAGTINIATRFNGMQLAPINVAGRARGVQLGLINYSEEISGAPIGLISIVRKGITELDVWSESNASAALLFRHGARRFYNVYGFGSTAPGNDSVQMFGYGFGSRLGSAGPVDLDVTLVAWGVSGNGVAADLSLLSQARLAAAVNLGRHFAVFGGLSYNVFVADSGENGDALNPVLDDIHIDGETTVRQWPSAFAGVRVR
jgi:hypothetical protein